MTKRQKYYTKIVRPKDNLEIQFQMSTLAGICILLGEKEREREGDREGEGKGEEEGERAHLTLIN